MGFILCPPLTQKPPRGGGLVQILLRPSAVLTAWQFFRRDFDGGADADVVEHFDDVSHAHADATVAGRAAEIFFLRRAVDVNVTLIGVAIVRFEPFQPHDAGDDGITARCVWLDHFTIPTAAFHDGSFWQSMTDFCDNFMFAQRGAVAAGAISQTKFGGGDFVCFQQMPLFIVDAHLLIPNTDDDISVFWGGFARGKNECERGDGKNGQVLHNGDLAVFARGVTL